MARDLYRIDCQTGFENYDWNHLPSLENSDLQFGENIWFNKIWIDISLYI